MDSNLAASNWGRQTCPTGEEVVAFPDLFELLPVTDVHIPPNFLPVCMQTCAHHSRSAETPKTEPSGRQTVQRCRILSCSERIHRPDPWPQLLWKARMNQINVEEALRCGSPTDSAGRAERVINKVPLHPPYILQSLMISSVFP